MKRRLPALLMLCTLVLSSCSDGAIDLTYRFEENEQGNRYLWTINSTTEIDSSTDHSTSTLKLVTDVLEQVGRPNPGEDPILTVTLFPKRLTQGGQTAKTPGKAVVKYKLDSGGHIVEPISSDLDPTVSSALELGTILTQSRLALPPSAVGIGDTWDAPLKLEGDTGSIDLDGKGKLVGFQLDGRRRLARIDTERTGDITAIEQLAGVLVELQGKTTSTAHSTLDVDRGALYSSTSHFLSDFNLAVQESGKLTGTMTVDLTSKLEFQPG